MKHSEKEIIDALNVIKDTCVESNCPRNCPFSISDECVIQGLQPALWEIEEVNIFKAFK